MRGSSTTTLRSGFRAGCSECSSTASCFTRRSSVHGGIRTSTTTSGGTAGLPRSTARGSRCRRTNTTTPGCWTSGSPGSEQRTYSRTSGRTSAAFSIPLSFRGLGSPAFSRDTSTRTRQTGLLAGSSRPTERAHDLVYRAARLPYWFGSHGQLKHRIGDAASSKRAGTRARERRLDGFAGHDLRRSLARIRHVGKGNRRCGERIERSRPARRGATEDRSDF